MTPPRRRASDQEEFDPMQTLLDDVALIKLHFVGGMGPDGPVKGLVNEVAHQHERLSLLERIGKWVAGIAAGIIIGTVVWGATTGAARTATVVHTAP